MGRPADWIGCLGKRQMLCNRTVIVRKKERGVSAELLALHFLGSCLTCSAGLRRMLCSVWLFSFPFLALGFLLLFTILHYQFLRLMDLWDFHADVRDFS